MDLQREQTVGGAILRIVVGHVDDPKNRAADGLLALQIHAGPPMLVEFKDILFSSQ